MANGLRVVIIGGGVAGMETAMTLGRSRHRDIETTLIDKGAVHYWKPMLHEFAAGTGEESRDCTTFVEASRRFGFRFIQSSLSSVDREKHEIRLANDEIVPYDMLVVALGSRSNDFGIEGVMQNCTFIDSLPDASSFHEKFRAAFRDAVANNRTLEVGIVGGGATGTQLAAELCSAIDMAPGYGKEARRNVLRLSLIETGKRILPAFPERVSNDARKQLEALGVSVLTEAMVTSVDEQGFHLKDGRVIPAELRVWAAGVRASAATELFEGLEIARGGQIVVNHHMQSTSDTSIFALGDCARINDEPLPATAQVARQQGIYLGRAIPVIAQGREPSTFVYRDRGAVVSLGDYNGWGMVGTSTSFGGGFLRGLAPRWLHDLIFRQHQIGVMGLARGTAAFLKAHLSPTRPRLDQ
ncbi:NAD(P)/FAD-dependent oxidoreductase [Asaia lannensis]|uniref:NAD(P)/FAD-dependent oxidoreductase n=1 Tax=Asaia lannensis NBRC 102526 TaxID=1307926 RepID=A0ABT1CEF1_9PROT|nr:NAD(P)/FAD-dependent oxidoreductase [Asaia lannensis]MCO6159232.1 NAD(P)/FAD-dependent oxidoreductase [Asaia lannensis NBRC 102526]GBQ97261.1 NADH dehydrogenase [Asaia lannensis NBRC 102526]